MLPKSPEMRAFRLGCWVNDLKEIPELRESSELPTPRYRMPDIHDRQIPQQKLGHPEHELVQTHFLSTCGAEQQTHPYRWPNGPVSRPARNFAAFRRAFSCRFFTINHVLHPGQSDKPLTSPLVTDLPFPNDYRTGHPKDL
jgi:hypothetical protein